MAPDLAGLTSLDQDSDPSTVREVQVDGDTMSSDGKGRIMYYGVDGSHAEISPDGFASYEGPEGSGISGEMNPDGSGSWTSTDGSTSYWEAGEITNTNLLVMEGLSNFDSIANSPEAEEAFGTQVMAHGKGSQFGLLQNFFQKHA